MAELTGMIISMNAELIGLNIVRDVGLIGMIINMDEQSNCRKGCRIDRGEH
jgi:hypothetical protein